jgi:hypothetical protein
MARTTLLPLAAPTLLLLLLSSLSSPSTASAQTADDTAAQAHFQVAASYYDMGDYESALREFTMAYNLSHRPQLHYNLSLCHQQLGHLTEAADALQSYLDQVTEIPNRTALTARLATLRERAARGETHTGDLETGGVETGGETGGETGAGETGAGETGAGETGAGETGAGEPGAGETGAGDTGESLNVGAIAGFSVAALGVVGIAVFGVSTISLDGDLAAGCGMSRSCSDGQISDLQTFALLTDISFGVSLVGAAIGTILLFVGGGSSDARAGLTPGLHLTPLVGASTGGPTAGLLVGGSF